MGAGCDRDPRAAATHLVAVPKQDLLVKMQWLQFSQRDPGEVGQGRLRGEYLLTRHIVTADGKSIYPLYSDGTVSICRTSALLDPAVQGQGEVVASLTHVPSSYRATGKHSIAHSGQKKPKWVLRSSCYPSPHIGGCCATTLHLVNQCCLTISY